MASKNDSMVKTLVVATVLCVVCSIIVSFAAVQLKPLQTKNKELDFKRNILLAAGMLEENADGARVEEIFKSIKVKLVDLSTGKYTDAVDVATYDQRKASKDPAKSVNLSNAEDIAGLGRLENYAKVFLVENQSGSLDKIILPIRGYGLWSTLRGFIALEEDFNTVIGLGYYEHAETPGLGGEVDNPKWKGLWPGKRVYDAQGNVELSVVKGAVDPKGAGAQYKVDGLSGATLTSDGVDNMIKFWMGQNGYYPFLKNLQSGGA